MRALKITAIVAVALVVVLGITAAVLYFAASAMPGGYHPPRLSQEQREEAADRFIEAMTDFVNKAEDRHPFELTFTQEAINEYLASAEEIVRKRPGTQDGTAAKAMDKAGLAGPMVRLNDGRLTLMARATEYDKIISVEIACESVLATAERSPRRSGPQGDRSAGQPPDNRLRLRVAGARIGRVPVPPFVVRGVLERVKERLGKPPFNDSHGAAQSLQPTARDVGKMLHAMIWGINEQPISTVHGFRKNRQVQISRIDISDGRMTIHYAPYGRKEIKSASASGR